MHPGIIEVFLFDLPLNSLIEPNIELFNLLHNYIFINVSTDFVSHIEIFCNYSKTMNIYLIEPFIFKGVLLTQFPKLHQISRKDLLGTNFAIMQKKFPKDYDFHPLTFNLPQDRQKLAKKMLEEQTGKNFW